MRGDSTCIDAAAATATVERLITAEGVKGIVGGMCSGETTASLQNAAMPHGMVMISPSATSPALSTLPDNGLFFRTSPSDARQGEVMTDEILEHGIKSVALPYTNNDYGKGLADSFAAAYEAKGGKVTINAAHDDGKADYSAEVLGEMLAPERQQVLPLLENRFAGVPPEAVVKIFTDNKFSPNEVMIYMMQMNPAQALGVYLRLGPDVQEKISPQLLRSK